MVLVDFDGVLVNFCLALKESLAKRGINYIIENTETYTFCGDIGCSRDEIYEEMHNPQMYDNMQVYDMALDGLNKLWRYDKVVAYTGCVNHPVVRSKRQKLINDFGLSGHVYVGGKPVILESDAVFEDELEKLVQFKKLGYDGYLCLIDHTYNRNKDDRKLCGSKLIIGNDFYDAVCKYIDVRYRGIED